MEYVPLQTRQKAAEIAGKRMDVVTFGFADTILILISEDSRLGKMYYVPLTAAPGGNLQAYDYGDEADDDFSLLPLSHLTPVSVLGGGSNEVEGKMYAVQIASMISRQNADERRRVVVGMGIARSSSDDIALGPDARRRFLDILTLVGQCSVW
ncbi:uncharacterized protein V1510DRAFT_416067 [Dipodascopsis tothii]|uniref:uncharacterized protein n=1 Tax=Dipodascopsis tothii TaxID=44089 RepID=UPI0034CEF244